jgi:CHAT domain-containing protein
MNHRVTENTEVRERECYTFECNLVLALFISILVLSESVVATPRRIGINLTQSLPEVLNLEPGKLIERTLNGNETDNYQITLQVGQYLHIIVEQRDIDVEVILYSPNGQELAISNSFNGTTGPEPISLIAPASGNYQLKVRRFEQEGNPETGRYDVRIDALRFPTEQDRNRVAAEQAYLEANQLALQATEESRQKAIAKWQEAVSIYRVIGDRATLAFILTLIGDNYATLGYGTQSINYYNQALSVYRDLGDSKAADNIRKILNDWGYQALLPEINEAKILESEGLELLSQGTEESLSRQAIPKVEEARLLYKKVGYKAGEANALRTLSLLYFELKDFQTALGCLNQSLLLLQELSDTAEEAEILYLMAQIYSDIKDNQKAIDYYNQSLQQSRKAGHKVQEAKTLNSMGVVYFYLGNKSIALDYFKQSLPVSQEVDTEAEAKALYHIAFVKRDLGNLTEGLSDIEAAVKLIEQIRSDINSERGRTLFLSSKQDYYKLYIDLLMQLHKKNPNDGYDAKALTVSERSRARSLLDLLTEANANIRQGVDPELLKKELTLQQELNELEQSRVKLLSGQYTNKQLTELKQQIKYLLRQLDLVKVQLRVNSPRYANLKYPEPLTLQEIQQQVLDDNTLLLEYSLGEERSYLWAVSKTGITSYSLPPRADIEAVAKEFYKQLNSPQEGSPEVGMKLSQMLLAPVANQLGQKRLLIVSDGALQSIPFAALPIPETTSPPTPLLGGEGSLTPPSLQGKGAGGLGFTPLLVQHEIVSLPSASTLAVLRNELKGRSPAAKTVAVIADPVFSTKDDRFLSSQPQQSNTTTLPSEVKRSATDIGVILDRLKYSRTEAETILSLVPATERSSALDFAASRATATSPDLAQYRMVHFATHGLLNNVHPELSGVVLSLVDEKGADTDGFLRLHDIFNLNLPAELVVLSACETGLGKDVQGEGLVGLTRGFMYAGAKRVAVSLWSVNDVATAELMKRFYQQMLEKGVNPVAALRAAQLEMLKSEQWKAPYYWAAFVVQGEWR